ncbi:MAG: OmpA family protein [Nitrospinae bacterium]|nr:OmpA family protein [Nitrospinota bacterium]
MKKRIFILLCLLASMFLNKGYLFAQDVKFGNFHTNRDEQNVIFDNADLDKLKNNYPEQDGQYKKYYNDGFELFRQGRFYDAHIKFMEAKDFLEASGTMDDIYYAAVIHSFATSYLWAVDSEEVKEDKALLKKLVELEDKAMDISTPLLNRFPENKGFLANQFITSGQISLKLGDTAASRKYFMLAMRYDPQNKTATDYVEKMNIDRKNERGKKLLANKNNNDLYRIKMEVDGFVSQLGIQDRIYTKLEGGDLTIINLDPLTFKSGEADISLESYPFMDKIVVLLNRFPYNIRVEGHTDDVPIKNSRFSSNYELSFARANNFVNYLISRGIDPERCTAAGYGESMPLYAEVKNKEKNRRIEIIFEKGEIRSLASNQ